MEPSAPAVERPGTFGGAWLPVVSLGLTVLAWLLIFTVPSDAPGPLWLSPFVTLAAGIVVGLVGVVSSVRAHRRRIVAVLAAASAMLTGAFWFMVFWTVAHLTLTP